MVGALLGGVLASMLILGASFGIGLKVIGPEWGSKVVATTFALYGPMLLVKVLMLHGELKLRKQARLAARDLAASDMAAGNSGNEKQD